MTNLSQVNENTRLKSQIMSDSHSILANTKGGGDPSRLGHITRATDYTSNIGMHTEIGGMGGIDRTTSAAGGAGPFSTMLHGPGS